jgi:zeaxanthin glucosyltransferase
VRIAFSTLAAAGHLNPMTTLARKVRERGHEVFFVGFLDAEPAVRTAGIEFHPVAEREFPAGYRREREAQLSKLSGPRWRSVCCSATLSWFRSDRARCA